MSRSFIDETIKTLKNSANEIQINWNKFKKGEINKEKFEELYEHILGDWLSELEHERYHPNNGCKYKDTNKSCEYFNKMNV